jgi:hypothetical protein
MENQNETQNIFLDIKAVLQRNVSLATEKSCELAKKLICAKFDSLSLEQKLKLVNACPKLNCDDDDDDDDASSSTFAWFFATGEMFDIECKALKAGLEEMGLGAYVDEDIFKSCCFSYRAYTIKYN